MTQLRQFLDSTATPGRSALIVAAVLQFGCSLVFIIDVIGEGAGLTPHKVIEALAVLALIFGSALAVRALLAMSKRAVRIERSLEVASGAFQAAVEGYFDRWGLTAAERDVALLSIKGVQIADIARMRDTREGTIKAQNAAIYRKSGVSNRAELISAVIEDLIAGMPLTPPQAQPQLSLASGSPANADGFADGATDQQHSKVPAAANAR